MADRFLTLNLEEILPGEPLPGELFIFINGKFLAYKREGDVMDRATYERFELKNVRTLFIREDDKKKYNEWNRKLAKDTPAPRTAQAKKFVAARDEVHRKTMDIFTAPHPDKKVAGVLGSSKKLVGEVMKTPYAVKSLAQLQTYSRGTVDHSVNVSVLSVYLAMQMGYTHQVILQHIGMGGLLHDIGKPKVPLDDSDTYDSLTEKMREHPTRGANLFVISDAVPEEVKLIIEQHHECHDGSGYPKKLRNTQIYDLARIVHIANVFDELVTDGQGTLHERQRHAVRQLDEVMYKKFEPVKLQKALKILKLGI